MRSWIPVPGTTTGRLVEAALDLFGSQGYAPVAVAAIAASAGVTTGSLYHHFGSKVGLYNLVRTDVERRVVDRLEGAAATAREVGNLADLAPILVVGFDYLVSSGFLRLLGEPSPDTPEATAHPDPVEELITRLLGDQDAPMPSLIAAAWRSALWYASGGATEARHARGALIKILTGS